MHSASFITCFSVGGFAQLGNTPGTVVLLWACLRGSKSPRWSRPAYVPVCVCITSAVFQIESHRCRGPPSRSSTHIFIKYRYMRKSSGLRFRQTANCPGATSRPYFRRRPPSHPLSLRCAFRVSLPVILPNLSRTSLGVLFDFGIT